MTGPLSHEESGLVVFWRRILAKMDGTKITGRTFLRIFFG